MNSLNSMTVANAPPEKLIEMRIQFDEKMEEIFDAVE